MMSDRNISSETEVDKSIPRDVAAIHEAGHVAVAIKYGIAVVRVTIDHSLPGADGLVGGAYTQFGGDRPRSIRDRERWAVATLAGREAERLYFREPLPEGSDAQDLKIVTGLLLEGQPVFVEDPPGSDIFVTAQQLLPARIDRLRRRAHRLVHTPWIRYRINSVREALLRRGSLTGAEIDEVIGQSRNLPPRRGQPC